MRFRMQYYLIVPWTAKWASITPVEGALEALRDPAASASPGMREARGTSLALVVLPNVGGAWKSTKSTKDSKWEKSIQLFSFRLYVG